MYNGAITTHHIEYSKYYMLIFPQDVTKCFDCTQQSPRKKNDVDK